MMLVYKEKIESNFLIGGVPCHIKAGYINGKVAGEVTCSLSSRRFEFEFDPLSSLKRKALIIAEIKRLYWDYIPHNTRKRGSGGKKGLILCHKSEAECDPLNYNFLDKE